MASKLWSINALANELGRNQRTVARALRDVPADGTTEFGHPGWHLATALKALERRARQNFSNSFDGQGVGISKTQQADEIERAALAVEKSMERLRAINDLEARRRLAQSGSFHVPVGPLTEALRASIDHQQEGLAPMLAIAVDTIEARLVGEVLDLLQWNLPA
jgi:hypothetical protein